MPALLGPFALTEPLAKGGMGQVWRAEHVRSGTPVAVKVLDRAHPALRAALLAEVGAVAGLRHPNIVWIHDTGTVDERVAAEAGIHPGTPWYAMELCGPTLRKRPGGFDWRVVREVLLDLLDALAHAHALGVIHRDIKPANVLMGLERPGLKLTDFGMVLLRERSAALSTRAPAPPVSSSSSTGSPLTGGTPTYMAPEQFAGVWGDQGPWTDLYAVGCLGFTLTTGRAPFRAKGQQAYRIAHEQAPIPPLVPRFRVPEGFEGWLRALLAKDPADRVRRAADAAAALHELDGHFAAAPAIALEEEAAEATTRLLPPPERRPSSIGGRRRAPLPPAPLPRSWAAPDPDHPLSLVDAGLGLFGLRALPLVGRAAERRRLWKALADVHTRHKPRAVLLSGPSGCGKSRLAAWLAIRAHEVGGAEVLTATHNPGGAVHDGLPGMLARDLGCLGARADVSAHRVTRLLGSGVDADLLRVQVHAANDAAAPRGRADERQAAALAHVERLCRERPVLLWIDDAHWGLDALGFASTLLDGDLPVLVLTTVRDEDLPACPEASARLDALASHPAATRMALGPLPRGHWRALVDAMLPLTDDLARQVADRCAGHPLFAVHLVSDWAERGLLEATPRGISLASAVELPTDIRALWSDRIDRTLSDRPTWRIPLELAAALGRDVQLTEWRAVCAEVGVAAPDELVTHLVHRRLADPTAAQQDRLSFVHGMLREGIEAAAGPRLADHHRACAAVLGAQPRSGARVGRHLLRAGDLIDALAPLLEGVKDAFEDGDHREQERLMRIREEALEWAGIPQTDPRWGQGWIERARWHYNARRPEDARGWWGRCREVGSGRPDWEVLLITVLQDSSLTTLADGRPEEAAALALQAAELARARGDERDEAHARYHHSAALVAMGALEPALEQLERAGAAFERLGHVQRVADCHIERALAFDKLGRSEDALAEADSAVAIAQEAGLEGLSIRARTARGQTLTNAGRHDEAIAALQEAWARIAPQPESRWWPFVRLKLVTALLAAHRDAEARDHLDALDGTLVFPQQRFLAAVAQLCLAEASARPAVLEELQQTAGAYEDVEIEPLLQRIREQAGPAFAAELDAVLAEALP